MKPSKVNKANETNQVNKIKSKKAGLTEQILSGIYSSSTVIEGARRKLAIF